LAYAKRGLIPSSSQCIGFGVPAVFAEFGTLDTAFVADIYECVSFPCRMEAKCAYGSLRDLHGLIRSEL
jgi:hypothetical protein